MNAAAAAQLTKPSLTEQIGTAGTLLKGTLPLFKSGVLGSMSPIAASKALKGVIQWSFLPAGLLAIARAGGLTLVQTPSDAQVRTMPEAALALLQPDFLLPIDAMRTLLAELDAPSC